MLVVHEQQDILKKLNYSAIRSNKLFMAEIDVTNRCNCHCFFCFQGNEHKDLEKTLSFDRIILNGNNEEATSLLCIKRFENSDESIIRNDIHDFFQLLYDNNIIEDQGKVMAQ